MEVMIIATLGLIFATNVVGLGLIIERLEKISLNVEQINRLGLRVYPQEADDERSNV